MAYDENLASRIENLLHDNKAISKKKMFGGLSFLYKGKMTVGIIKDELVVRVISPKYKSLLLEDGIREMDFNGKSMKEFIFVAPERYHTEEQLQEWINLGIEHAKSKLKQLLPF